MVTINNTDFTSNQSLAAILYVKTKADMLSIIKKLDLYVSPNLKKDETARRVAAELLDNPVAILSSLCKAELELLDEFIKAGPNAYITRKIRKTEYKLQKFCLALTHEGYAHTNQRLVDNHKGNMVIAAEVFECNESRFTTIYYYFKKIYYDFINTFVGYTL